MKNNGKIKKIILGVICGVAAVVGVLLAAAIETYSKSGDFAHPQFLYIVAVLLIVLTALLAVLFVMIILRKKSKPAEVKVLFEGQVATKTEQQTRSDENAGEEGVRFDGLTRLDESKTSFVRATYDDKISLKGL
ncbi:MAG: hypothetical protein K2H30_01620, partial [Clostridia bacterium]|nr:hypothetical protein [Clostridia bacterium]